MGRRPVRGPAMGSFKCGSRRNDPAAVVVTNPRRPRRPRSLSVLRRRAANGALLAAGAANAGFVERTSMPGVGSTSSSSSTNEITSGSSGCFDGAVATPAGEAGSPAALVGG